MPSIIVASFGTSFAESREATIGAIERKVAEAFPEHAVYRAFTSNFIIRRIEKAEGVHIPTVGELLEQLFESEESEVIIVPTHLMNAKEYQLVLEQADAWQDRFKKLRVALPLLSDDEDYARAIDALSFEIRAAAAQNACVILMGHGTSGGSNACYAKLQETLDRCGYENCFVCIVDSEPGFDSVIDVVRRAGYKKAVLRVFMVVAGAHAHEDMAGNDKTSLKSRLEACEIATEVISEGLGAVPSVADIYIDHARAAMA
jgi:sirohydrochlorin cobaltochelatase